jgi:hypothetical protein
MNQYGVLIYAGDSAHRPDASPADTASCDDHADQLVADGAMLTAYALTPRDMARSVRAPGLVTDGPFTEAKEIVAGFYVIEAIDMEMAVKIASTNPAIAEGGGVEVRPIASGGVIREPS